MDHDFERVADLQLFGLDGEREFPERKRPLGFAADVDEQFILILGDDDARQDLAFVENLEALFVEALFERELVFFFVERRFRRERGSDKWLLPYNIFILFLAAPAPPSAALPEDRADDCVSAARARFAETAVNGEFILKSPLEPLGVNVIIDARPTRVDRPLENVHDRAVEPASRRF